MICEMSLDGSMGIAHLYQDTNETSGYVGCEGSTYEDAPID